MYKCKFHVEENVEIILIDLGDAPQKNKMDTE